MDFNKNVNRLGIHNQNPLAPASMFGIVIAMSTESLSNSVSQPSNEIEESLGLTSSHKLVLIIAGAAILGGAGIYVEKARRDAQEDAVALELSSAKTPQTKRAVALKHIGSRQSALALIDLASQEQTDGKYADAILTYQKYLAHYADHPLASSVKYGLALSLESSGKLPDAAEALRALVADKNSVLFAPQALLALSRIELARGNSAAARQALQDLSAQHGQSVCAQEARERLKKLSN